MAEQTNGTSGGVPAQIRGSFLIERVYADSAEEQGITALQGVLLCRLFAAPLGVTELGLALGLDRPALNELVDRTETRGFLAADASDARRVVIALTARGRSTAQSFYNETCRQIEALTYGLSRHERAVLASQLGQFMVPDQV